MRNLDRIPEMLAAIEERWRESPDQWLGQLIANLAAKARQNENDDPFYLEDEELLEALGTELSCEYFVGENPWEEETRD